MDMLFWHALCVSVRISLISNIEIAADPACKNKCGDLGMLPICYDLNLVTEVPWGKSMFSQ